MKPRITIRLFGRFSFNCGEQEVLLHTSSKAKEILCYLLVNRRTPVPRDRLAALISHEDAPDRCGKTFRHALWQLKADLSSNGTSESDRILRIGEEWLQFIMDEGVSLDVAEFELAAKKAEKHTQVVGLYTDEFLHGWDQDWCNEERERLRQIYLETLDSLLDGCVSSRDVKGGVAYGMLVLHNDATREHTHRALMGLYALVGDRKSALEQYERCVRALRNHLEVEPDDATKALEREIRAGHSLTIGPEYRAEVAAAESALVVANAELAKLKVRPIAP